MLQNVEQTLWKVEQVKEGKDGFSSLLDFPYGCRDNNIVAHTKGRDVDVYVTSQRAKLVCYF